MTSSEVYALRYASRPDNRASGAYYRYDLYGRPDIQMGLDYFFWLVRSPHGLVVVDCGFTEEVAKARGRSITTQPAELLWRMGVDPGSVDHLVLSHMHFDHVGNIPLFPNATVHIARAEHDYWSGRHRDVPSFSWPVEPADVDLLEVLRRDERLAFVDDEAQILPGVALRRLPGHTPGQLVAEVDTEGPRIVIASDAMHYYDEVRLNQPIHLFTDLAQLLDSYELLRSWDERPDVDVIPGHDPRVTTDYVHVQKDCIDLTRKVPAPAGPDALAALASSSES